MAAKKRVVVAGAGGVFGTHLVRLLAGAYDVVPSTRETLDLEDVDAVRSAARGAFAFACTAGPFQQLDRRIVRAVVDAGAHWLDIADDERWFFDLLDDRELDALARQRGVVVMPGLSTLPAISCALVRRVLPAERVIITLGIGNDNPKGAAAIASGASLRTPDRELLQRELGIEAIVRSRFQLPGARLALHALRLLPIGARLRVARVAAHVVPRFGSPGGYVEARGSRTARIGGAQQMAVLPLLFALARLQGRSGCLAPGVFDAEELLSFVEEAGRAARGGAVADASSASGTPGAVPE